MFPTHPPQPLPHHLPATCKGLPCLTLAREAGSKLHNTTGVQAGMLLQRSVQHSHNQLGMHASLALTDKKVSRCSVLRWSCIHALVCLNKQCIETSSALGDLMLIKSNHMSTSRHHSRLCIKQDQTSHKARRSNGASPAMLFS